jgi:adenylate kinase family enzyme
MQRVMIVGISGAGKSTLAKAISGKLGMPCHHLDALFHNNGWKPRPEADVRRDFDALAATSIWVVDGNYRPYSSALQNRADTFIFLDFNRFSALFSILKRWSLVKLGILQRADGLDDKISFTYLKWVWGWNDHSRHQWMETLDGLSCDIHVFHSRKAAYRWLESLSCSV